MDGYVKSALFVYTDSGHNYLDAIENNDHGTTVTSVSLEDMRKDPDAVLSDQQHVVIAAGIREIKEIITIALKYDCSFGLLPIDSQKSLEKCYSLPRETKDQIELALRNPSKPIDLLYCNETILFYKGVIGHIPLFDTSSDTDRIEIIWSGLRRLFSLHLQPFKIRTFGKEEQRIDTAAIGCVVLESHETGLLAKMVENDCSYCDGMITMLIMAPFSVFDYLKMIWARLLGGPYAKAMANSLGLVRCPEVEITTEMAQKIIVDDDETISTPAALRVEPGIFRLNTGLSKEVLANESNAKEKFRTASLPEGKELVKAREKRLPFFTYASEQRFKELFSALRADTKLDTIYVVLMVLSTMIATVGLYLDSSSVIIGAMLLAPLMAPIISMAMGLLRYDQVMFNKSLIKIVAGILLALGASATFALVSPYQPFTGEMQGRLNPTVLDLIVAIVAGIAGAYTKSHKEILQSMAGVAIAVALVPPLSVAGIGLGRFDLAFFFHAFLLFFTNLIGIVLAATFTFRVLGFSPAVKNKKSLSIFTGLLAVILIPLFIAFQGIVDRSQFEKGWQVERFMVNGKYLIVEKADLHTINNTKVLTVDILAREPLDRWDLNEFKRKVNRNFSEHLVIRANVTYIP